MFWRFCKENGIEAETPLERGLVVAIAAMVPMLVMMVVLAYFAIGMAVYSVAAWIISHA